MLNHSKRNTRIRVGHSYTVDNGCIGNCACATELEGSGQPPCGAVVKVLRRDTESPRSHEAGFAEVRWGGINRCRGWVAEAALKNL